METANTFFSSLSQESNFNSDNLDQNLIKICEDVEKNLIEDATNDSLYNSRYDSELYRLCKNIDKTITVEVKRKSTWNILTLDDEILYKLSDEAEKTTVCREAGLKRETTEHSERPSKCRRLCDISTSPRSNIRPVPEIIDNHAGTLETPSKTYRSYPGARSLIKSAWLKKAISTTEKNVDETLASLSEECLKEYDKHLKRWFLFCTRYNLDYCEAHIYKVIYFLMKMFYEGLQFDDLCTCRSALALLDKRNLCKEDNVQRLFKEIYRLRTSGLNISCHTTAVLNFVGIFYPYENIPLDIISKKLATLLALSTARPIKDIQQLNLNQIEILPKNKVLITFPNQWKDLAKPLLVLFYVHDRPEICPGRALEAYLGRTKNLRNNEKKLFISLNRPYKAVTANTLSRWIKEVVVKSGVDSTLLLTKR